MQFLSTLFLVCTMALIIVLWSVKTMLVFYVFGMRNTVCFLKNQLLITYKWWNLIINRLLQTGIVRY